MRRLDARRRQRLLRHPGDPRTWILRPFDQLLEEGRESGTVMCIPLHAYLVGQPHRIGGLEEALEYITGHSPDDVWVTTAVEIAEYYFEHYYDTCLDDIRTRGRATA